MASSLQTWGTFIHQQRDAWHQLSPASSAAWEQGKFFTPREAGGEFCFQPSLSVRVRKYQRAGEEKCTDICWLQRCFDESGGLKLIVLKDNGAGDFPTEN